MGSPHTPHDAQQLIQQLQRRIRALELRKPRGGGTPEATTATANTLAKRDASARIKAADGVAADDVVTVGQLTDGDVDWTGVTYNSGFEDSTLSPVAVRKLGGVIYIRGIIERISYPFRDNTTYSATAILPAWARPAERTYTALGTDDSVAPASGVFNSANGNVQVRMGTGADADWVGVGGLSWPAA